MINQHEFSMYTRYDTGDGEWLKCIIVSLNVASSLRSSDLLSLLNSTKVSLFTNIYYILLETLSAAVSDSYHYRPCEHSENFRFYSVARRHFDPFKTSASMYIYLLNVKCTLPCVPLPPYRHNGFSAYIQYYAFSVVLSLNNTNTEETIICNYKYHDQQ